MEVTKKSIEIYHDNNGREPFTEWVKSISMSDRSRIFSRLDRVESGNLGDYKPVGDDVYELRFHFGSGFRVYYGEVNNQIILLLCGGEKSSQKKDVKKAKVYWKDFINR